MISMFFCFFFFEDLWRRRRGKRYIVLKKNPEKKRERTEKWRRENIFTEGRKKSSADYVCVIPVPRLGQFIESKHVHCIHDCAFVSRSVYLRNQRKREHFLSNLTLWQSEQKKNEEEEERKEREAYYVRYLSSTIWVLCMRVLPKCAPKVTSK